MSIKTRLGPKIRATLAGLAAIAVAGVSVVALNTVAAPTAEAATSAYTGATTTAAWKLAPGIHDLVTLRANPGAQQTYFGKGAPACTEDGRSFQVDVYKYDATHKPLVDKLVAGGVTYLAPKTPNDSAVFVSAQIVTPPRCKPNQPEPIVTKEKETDLSCAEGVRTRDKTTTVDWTWNEASWSWVKGEPVVTYSKWDKVRDLNPAEKSELKCEKPAKPEPIVTKEKETDLSCAEGVRTRDKTTTVDWTWNEASWSWVKGEPVVTYSKWDKVRDLNPAEKEKLGCNVPGKPADIVQVDTKTWNDCKVVLKQDKITTTKYVWNKDTWSWVKAKPVVTYDKATKVRDMTHQERIDQGCIAKPTKPKPQYPASAPTGGDYWGPSGFGNDPRTFVVLGLFLASVLGLVIRRRGSVPGLPSGQ